MNDKLKNLLDRLTKGRAVPGVPMTPAQLVTMAEEVDRALSDLPPADRAAVLKGVLGRVSHGGTAVDSILLEAGQGLRLQELAYAVAKAKPPAS
jgi:hypothetical protein